MYVKREMMELFAVPDVFVSGMGSVEPMSGGNFRFTFFIEQEVYGKTELVVVAKIIMSIEALPEAIHMAAFSTNTCACENARKMTKN